MACCSLVWACTSSWQWLTHLLSGTDTQTWGSGLVWSLLSEPMTCRQMLIEINPNPGFVLLFNLLKNICKFVNSFLLLLLLGEEDSN